MGIAENLLFVRGRIAEAAVKCGRAPEDITLVCAAKTNGAPRVREAIAAGALDIGENRVQEMREKLAQGAYDGARLHFIGRLQRNKVNKVAGECFLIHSADSPELLAAISRRAGELSRVQDVLLEVNIGREPGKSGAAPEELGALLDAAALLPHIRVRGLMSIPPAEGGIAIRCNYFDLMHNLFVDISAKKYDNVSMDFMSMGMSADYCEAIAAGANIVRVGSAVFGPRI